MSSVRRGPFRLALLARLIATVAVLGGAGSSGAAEIWSTPATILQLYPLDTGLIVYTDYTNPLSTCGSNRWLVSASGPNYKVLVAAMLLAYSQGQKVQLHLNDQPPACEPVVDRFLVQRP